MISARSPSSSVWELGTNQVKNSCFRFQNNLKGASWSRYLFALGLWYNHYGLKQKPSCVTPSSVHYDHCDITTCATTESILRKAFPGDRILSDEHFPDCTAAERCPSRHVPSTVPRSSLIQNTVATLYCSAFWAVQRIHRRP